MVILCDMDGVVAQLEKPWLEMYNRDYNDCLTVEDINDFNWSKCVKPECGNKIFDYLKVEGLFLNCEPYLESVDALMQLYLDKHDIYFVTKSPTDSRFAYFEKLEWIDKHVPFVGRDRVICTGQKHMVRGDVLIDDYPKNLINFPGKRILMDRPWNRQVQEPSLVRVHSWFEVLIQVQL